MKGLTSVRPYFDNAPFISVITEMEILGVKDISEKEIKTREFAIEFCSIVPFSNKIKERAIAIKKMIKIPLPDAIIAASALVEDMTLVTADKGFKRIRGLQLILIEV
jgi:predicted nucleic acid-binding protein